MYLLFMLGRMAYDNYQKRKARDNMLAYHEQSRSPSAETIEMNANNEILEKTGLVPPPSYNAVMANDTGKKLDLEAQYDGYDSETDDEGFDEIVDGIRSRNLRPQQRHADAVQQYDRIRYEIPPVAEYRSQRRGGCCGGRRQGCYTAPKQTYLADQNRCQSRCQQKRAAKAARKAERWAARAAETRMPM